MTQQYSFPGPSGLTDQYAARKDLAGLIVRSAAGVPRAGLFPRAGAAPVTARADMQVDVIAFEAAAVQFGGVILLANDAVAQVPIATAPASNSRIDVVYVKQNENAAPATDADNSLVLAAVTGTPAASPTKPALPVGAVELATVLVPAGKTATNQSGVVITSTNAYTATTGGLVWVRNQTELAAWAPPDGNQAWSIADQTVYLRTGGAWVSTALPTQPLSGNVTTIAGGVVAANFPAGYFTKPPIVLHSVVGAGSVLTSYLSGAPTVTQANFAAYAGATRTPATVSWVAYPVP